MTFRHLGALVTPRGVDVRVWAPEAHTVALVMDGQELPMVPAEDGTWQLERPGGPDSRYAFRVDGRGPFPDPYSRAQPDGVHGASAVFDPAAYPWHDADWRGLRLEDLVIYQCHVGTATAEGTLDSLIEHLPRLSGLGMTALQLLPLAESPGRWNWGYDGVDLFAVSHNYGGPAALQRFVDAAHQHRLGVILDVVYNHFGPDGCYLREFSPSYFTSAHQTPWGEAVNFDGPNAHWVRRFVLDNARGWLLDFHLDGLRLDATHAVIDRSPRHILAELADHLRSAAERPVVMIAESAENDVRYLVPADRGGLGMDAVYADDFHHALRRYLLGDDEGYYEDYQGMLAEVARVIQQGWLFEGQPARHWGNRPRGTPARDRPAPQFLYAIQNHDQVGNRPFGDRLHHRLDLDRYRVVSALLLLLPYTPLVFMGQEFAASSPFQYFTDHDTELGRLVTEGRRKEFGAFAAFADPTLKATIPDPQQESTFRRSKLRLEETEVEPGAGLSRLYAALLRLRRADPVLRVPDRQLLESRAVGPNVLLVQRGDAARARFFVANFGDQPAAVPLASGDWRVLVATDALEFGGTGRAVTVAAESVLVPARSAVLLAAGGE